MEKIENKEFSGERSQYFAHDLNYDKCLFKEGESCLKHTKNVIIENTVFDYKYPLWICENVLVKKSHFNEKAKSGLWYVKNFRLEDSLIEAPKEFRRSSGIKLINVNFTNAQETLWTCSNIKMKNVKARGDYLAMNSKNFYADNLELEGNYFLDGAENIEIHNSHLVSKDAFWNCKNVTVYDSYIWGEYLGWHSKNLKFVNCTIESNQGLCYVDGLVMKNCILVNTDLAFEYSRRINADIKSSIVSVKNPCGGKIKAMEIETLILNPARCNVKSTKIICDKITNVYSKDPNANENDFLEMPLMQFILGKKNGI